MTVQVDWPERGRAIGEYVERIDFTLSHEEEIVAIASLARNRDEAYADSVTFTGELNENAYVLTAEAYALGAEEGDDPIAVSHSTVSLTSTEVVSLDVNAEIATQVASVEVSGTSSNLDIGDSLSITVSAKDADGALLLGESRWFDCSITAGAEFVTLSETNVLTGVAEGQSTVTCIDPASNVSGTFDVTVNDPTAEGLVVAVDWPERTRSVGQFVERIEFTLANETETLASKTFNRSKDAGYSDSISLGGDLLQGTYLLEAKAYSLDTQDGSAPVAVSQTTVDLNGSQVTTINLNAELGTRVESVAVSGTKTVVDIGDTAAIGVSARDAEGALLLTAPRWFDCSISAGADFATLSSDNVLTGVAEGQSMVTCIEPNSGIPGSFSVTINDPTIISSLKVYVDWPGYSRSVPDYADRVDLVLTDADGQNWTASITRHSTDPHQASASFGSRIAGDYTLQAEAIASLSGGDSLVGTASLPVTIGADPAEVNLSADLESRVASLTINNTPDFMLIGDTVQLTTTARDSDSNVVLLPNEAITWTDSGAGEVSLSATGEVNALSAGTGGVQAVETGSGVRDSVSIEVLDPLKEFVYFSGGLKSTGEVKIYRVRLDGTDAQRITNGSDFDSNPTISPDNSKIAFSRLSISTFKSALYIANIDGSNVQKITPDGNSRNPNWHPDGDRLIYERDGDVYEYDLDTGQETVLVNTAHGHYRPNWNPTGTHIAFDSTRDGNGDVYVVNADGTNETRLTTGSGWEGYVTWTPEGNIYYASYLEERIVMMDPDSSNKQTLISFSDPSITMSKAKRSALSQYTIVDYLKNNVERSLYRLDTNTNEFVSFLSSDYSAASPALGPVTPVME